MDETDVALIRLLVYNSRMSYSELAEALGISVQSAHRRVQALVSSGAIGRFPAAFSVVAHRGIWVMVHGRSLAPSLYKALGELEKESGMDMVLVAADKYLYISGVVLDPNRINRFVTAVTRTAKLDDPQVGVVQFPVPIGEVEPVIYPMDVRIVQALKDDARRPVTEIAKELGVAPRTVTRHIDRLSKEMLVHFSTELFLNRSSDLFAALHLTVRKGEDREKVATAMVKQLAMREIITYTFGDRPDQLIVLFWSPDIRSINDLVADLERSGVFEEVRPNIILDARYYSGLRDATPPVRGEARG